MKDLDKTYKHGSSLIDSITAISGIIEYVEEYQLINYNDIVELDHRAYIIDIAIDKYFDKEFSSWGNINRVIMNPARRNHREVFVELIENQLNVY